MIMNSADLNFELVYHTQNNTTMYLCLFVIHCLKCCQKRFHHILYSEVHVHSMYLYVFITAIDVDIIIDYSHSLAWPNPTHAEAGNTRLSSRTGAYVVTDFKMGVGWVGKS